MHDVTPKKKNHVSGTELNVSAAPKVQLNINQFSECPYSILDRPYSAVRRVAPVHRDIFYGVLQRRVMDKTSMSNPNHPRLLYAFLFSSEKPMQNLQNDTEMTENR